METVWGICEHDSETYFVGEREDSTKQLFKHCECVSEESASYIANALDPDHCIREDFADK